MVVELNVSELVGLLFATTFAASLCAWFMGYLVSNILDTVGLFVTPKKKKESDAAG